MNTNILTEKEKEDLLTDLYSATLDVVAKYQEKKQILSGDEPFDATLSEAIDSLKDSVVRILEVHFEFCR